MHPIVQKDLDEIVARLAGVAPVFEGTSVLITGGRGFLGSYLRSVLDRLSEKFLDKPCTTTSIDNMITSSEHSIEEPGPHHRFIKQDVRERLKLNSRFDFVVHAAGIASPYYYRKYPLETLEVATIGTKNVLELARRDGAKLLYFSSSEIYGDPDPVHVPTPESYRGNVSVLGPRACYDEGKRVGETLCYIYFHEYGTPVNIVRPFNVYGPGMNEDDYRVLPSFASAIKAGAPLKIYATGRQTRTYCYITDAMVGLILAMVRGVLGEAYNIGSPRPEISVLDLAAEIENVVGRKLERKLIEYPDSYPGDEPQRRCPDIRKARLQLEYEPKVDLHTGLERFLSWTDDVYTGGR